MANFDSLWDYSNPAQTELVFQELLSTTRGEELAELLTQIARALGLQGKFAEAEATLDRAEGLLRGHMPRARVRCVLERGRVLNTRGDSMGAKHLFIDAWHLARANRLDGLAVDAAHMIAIASSASEATTWNERALALVDSSQDPDAKRWRGALHNNMGWTLHGDGRFDEALRHFELALEARLEQGKREQILIAEWCVARGLRSVGRVEEALDRQLHLRQVHAEEGERSGFVEEEIAECLRLLGRNDEAVPHFAIAYEELSKDRHLVDQEPDRIIRLKVLSNTEPGAASVL